MFICLYCFRPIYEEDMDCSLKTLASPKLRDTSDADSPCCTSPPECAICLQRCVHPVRLPCNHIFCFLCVKGASWHSKRCALCRQEIPEDFLDRPVLLLPEELKAAAAGVGRTEGTEGGRGDFAWYYEGRNGWWQYDERTSHELEEAFSKGKKSTEMLIAGFLYVADLENLVQYRRNEHGRRRKIKRDTVDIPKKGVAGLRLDSEPALPAVTPATREHIILPDGSDAASQSPSVSLGLVASPPPVRPPTLLGHHLNSSTSPSITTLEDSFSQLLLSQPESAEMGGEDEQQISESASENEEERECDVEMAQSFVQKSLRENRPVRMPPRGGSSSVRSRSPDGQCTVTEV